MRIPKITEMVEDRSFEMLRADPVIIQKEVLAKSLTSFINFKLF